jgi:hypothetical protein
MLADIASIEIPPLPQRLVDWLKSETDGRLASLGIARETITIVRFIYGWHSLNICRRSLRRW